VVSKVLTLLANDFASVSELLLYALRTPLRLALANLLLCVSLYALPNVSNKLASLFMTSDSCPLALVASLFRISGEVTLNRFLIRERLVQRTFDFRELSVNFGEPRRFGVDTQRVSDEAKPVIREDPTEALE
jgi:hypothetical protein